MNTQNSQPALASADRIAARHALRLTDTRREVLELVTAASQPLTAYQLIDRLRERRGKAVTPPIVYRALSFLTEHGFVHRLESLNAFVACHHLEEAHSSQFVICTNCGRTEEFSDLAATDTLNDQAKSLGFTVAQQIVELRGLCGECHGLSSSPA